MSAGFDKDPHSEAGCECPRNLFGIRQYNELHRIERVLTHKRSVELIAQPVTGDFDLVHLRSIHRYLFQDVFPWAGEFRVVNISKTAMFAPARHIVGAMTETLARLGQERFLRGLAFDAFCERAAFYLGEINAIHPFREGNGRTQRELIRQLALGAGYTLSWAGFTQEEMVAASIASHVYGENGGLAAILRRARWTGKETQG